MPSGKSNRPSSDGLSLLRLPPNDQRPAVKCMSFGLSLTEVATHSSPYRRRAACGTISWRGKWVRWALASGCREVTSMELRFWYSVYGTTGDAPSPSAMSASLRPPIDGLVHKFEPG